MMSWNDVSSSDPSNIEERPVTVFKSILRYNYEIGSRESIELHIALSKVSDITIFNSEPVKKLIEYKWRKLSWIHKALCFKYFLYLGALMVHAN